jgi:hypothetical protein
LLSVPFTSEVELSLRITVAANTVVPGTSRTITANRKKDNDMALSFITFCDKVR